MQELTLTLEESPSPDDVRIIDEGLDEYNLSFVPPHDYRPLAVFLRNAEGEVVGGAYGGTYWGWLYVKYLWIAEEYRARGYGRQLMEAAHAEAARRGCQRCHLDTLDFQALRFYQQLGYQIFGILEDCPPGHQRFFLHKRDLAAAAGIPGQNIDPSPPP